MKANEIKALLSLLKGSVSNDSQKIVIEHTFRLINKYEKQILILRKDLWDLSEKNIRVISLLGGSSSMGEMMSRVIGKDRYLAGYDIFNSEVEESYGTKQTTS